ncbi:hypothetical protein EJ06DRAFT_372004 [Trichodelitschia bisporula]|uniref:Rhodopsin domain-containing protein n=1 Tax=Trichodelitschia bisporula TaxID=703511 RepID=A0A6G1I217_9PEZI|nr:hypothetical protein EJ06DRAFT_372004 [Trichodelitschia bisporula]
MSYDGTIFELPPSELAKALAYAARYPDFDPTFIPPRLLNPEYVPPNTFPRFEALAYVTAVLTTGFVLARLWIRGRVKKLVFGLDDWLIIPGQLATLWLIATMVLLGRLGGCGLHVYDASWKRVLKTQELEFVGVIAYFSAVCLVRASIIAFYYRLIGVAAPRTRVFLHITSVALTLQFIVQVFTFVFGWRPIRGGWDLQARLDGAVPRYNLALSIFFMSIVYLLMDIWLLVLPIHTVLRLRLPLGTRVGVSSVFLFGAFACVGAVLKTAYVYRVFNSYDRLWTSIGFMYGALVELGFGVVSACLPAMHHIVLKRAPRMLGDVFGKSRVSMWFGTGSRSASAGKPADVEAGGEQVRPPGITAPPQSRVGSGAGRSVRESLRSLKSLRGGRAVGPNSFDAMEFAELEEEPRGDKREDEIWLRKG